jgi:LPXTG-motif cell wall-anchored protein
MTRVMKTAALAVAVLCGTAGAPLAQETQTSSETKTFEIIAVEGNKLDVRLPEGTKELTVPDDFRFTVNGQPLSVSELKPGMKGTATITTRTTTTPVTVTEVKNGTVVKRSGGTLIVRTPEGVKSFTQGDADKRGVKMVRDGKPAELSDFREGDQLSATIITTRPPRVMTEREVQAIVPTAAPTAGSGTPAPAARQAPAPRTPVAATPNASPSSASQSEPAHKLPKTASSWPVLAFAGIVALALGLTLTITRRAEE